MIVKNVWSDKILSALAGVLQVMIGEQLWNCCAGKFDENLSGQGKSVKRILKTPINTLFSRVQITESSIN